MICSQKCAWGSLRAREWAAGAEGAEGKSLPVLLCLVLEGWRMRGAGYDVLGMIEGAACASGTVQVEGVCTALHPASYGGSPLVAVCAPTCTCSSVGTMYARTICYGRW